MAMLSHEPVDAVTANLNFPALPDDLAGFIAIRRRFTEGRSWRAF